MEDGGACSQLRSFAHCSLKDVLDLSWVAACADLGKVYNGTGSVERYVQPETAGVLLMVTLGTGAFQKPG